MTLDARIVDTIEFNPGSAPRRVDVGLFVLFTLRVYPDERLGINAEPFNEVDLLGCCNTISCVTCDGQPSLQRMALPWKWDASG